MAFAIDSILVILFIASVVSGYKKGFLVTVIDAIGFFASFAAAMLLAKPFAQILKGTGIYAGILQGIKSSFSSLLQTNGDGADLAKMFSEQPEGFKRLLMGFGTDFDKAGDQFSRLVESGVENANARFVEYIVTPAANAVTIVLSFLIIFAVCSVAVLVINALFKGLSKLPVLSGVNRIAGLLLGVAIGLVRVYIACMLLRVLLPYMGGLGFGLSPEIVRNTVLYEFISKQNPFGFFAGFKL